MKNAVLILVCVITSLLAVYTFGPRGQGTGTAAAKEDVYARVMRTKTIRCGYGMWPPYAIYKDGKTGEIKGFFHDIMEEVGHRLGMKIVWTEEVGWGPGMNAGLLSDRYDLICGGVWGISADAPYFQLSIPVNYSVLHLYARADDHRFDADLSILNDPNYTLAGQDGEMSSVVGDSDFPKAKKLYIQSSDEITQMVMNVAYKKADAVFTDPSLAQGFAKANPGKIRQVTAAPYSIYPNMIAAKLGERKFMDMIDTVLTEMHNTGAMDKIIAKHVHEKGIFMPVAKPYIFVAPEALP